MACHSFSCAAAGSSPGNTFFAHASLGMATMLHWILSFIVYSRHSIVARPRAFVTRAILAGSMPA